jgi:hypothetical protein
MLGDDGLELLAGGLQAGFLGGSPGYTQMGVGNDAGILKNVEGYTLTSRRAVLHLH